MNDAPQIVWHETTVDRHQRESLLGQRGMVIWLTGLSGCGKSTIANVLDGQLNRQGRASMLLDGDNIRHGLCAPPQRLVDPYGDAFAKRFGLGFGAQDRQENIRRIGHVADLMATAGLITIAAFVSPYRADRDAVRKIVQANEPDRFFEVFVDTPLEECERRDPKGLYKKARAGEIPNFTGISDPYEAPESPEVHIRWKPGMTPADQASEIAKVILG